MMNKLMTITLTALLAWAFGAVASAENYFLLTGVNAGMTPGISRPVFPSGPPAVVPGSFFDGDRLAGTAGASPAPYLGTGTPLLNPNPYGSLSFMFRRGSIPLGAAGNQPLLSIDYLGGPLLDLDGDLNNNARSLAPVASQTPVEIPGSSSFIGLSVDTSAGMIGLTNFDATATNQGFSGFGPDIAVTVNTLAGTQPDGTLGGAINPSIDTRQGALSLHAPGVWRVSNFGYELWQDSIDPTSSTASTLGTFQYLGNLRGWVIERDGNGNFPTLAGMGLGTTLWPLVDTSEVGNLHAQSSGMPPFVSITDGPAADKFTAPGNGGLPLTDFGGDLGAYLDSVVLPLVDPLSQRVVYLESAGFGMNNSFDPVFGDTIGYDVVLIAQSTPIPEPTTLGLLALGMGVVCRFRRRIAR